MAVIDVTNATFAYGDRPVIENVSLRVEEGTFLGLIGPNGSGKTTLLELMIGLRRPDAGSVFLFDQPAHSFADGERIGYVAQEVTSVGSAMPITVEEAVRMGRYPHRLFGRFTRADRDAIDAALERVGIRHLSNRRVGQLSGGQRQRVFIARALAANGMPSTQGSLDGAGQSRRHPVLWMTTL
jgi:zinc transport system ATP-binding protein